MHDPGTVIVVHVSALLASLIVMGALKLAVEAGCGGAVMVAADDKPNAAAPRRTILRRETAMVPGVRVQIFSFQIYAVRRLLSLGSRSSGPIFLLSKPTLAAENILASDQHQADQHVLSGVVALLREGKVIADMSQHLYQVVW